ncbi:protein cramped-like [Planoprotostelium fungivorum]|uniref:Protein cramped-like n=1 Tax=Planoprotostelium fungivorum TaxID=1890364 RepID=A0A2P6NVS8_9EUKA|nr:protein cramped-like [Planoprotostelium fungivorum]
MSFGPYVAHDGGSPTPDISINGIKQELFIVTDASNYDGNHGPPTFMPQMMTNNWFQSDPQQSTLFIANNNQLQSERQPDGRKRRSLSADVSKEASSVGRSRSVSPKRDSSSSPSGHTKRGWESWSLEEMEAFFNGLRAHGRDFEQITNSVKTKNYDQVRYFYYRILNKTLKLLKPNKIDKKDIKEVMNALFCFWELRRAVRGKDEEYSPEFAQQLKDKIAQTSASITFGAEDEGERGRQGKSKDVSTNRSESFNYGQNIKVPVMNVVDNNGQSVNSAQTMNNNRVPQQMGHYSPPYMYPPQTTTGMGYGVNEMYRKTLVSDHPPQAVQRVTIQLVPSNTEIQHLLSSNGQNPRLQITLKGNKSISFLSKFLSDKWTIRDANFPEVRLVQSPIFFYPLHDTQHPGWTASTNDVNISDIQLTCGNSPVVRIEYAWHPYLYRNTTSPFSLPLDNPNNSLQAPPIELELSPRDPIEGNITLYPPHYSSGNLTSSSEYDNNYFTLGTLGSTLGNTLTESTGTEGPYEGSEYLRTSQEIYQSPMTQETYRSPMTQDNYRSPMAQSPMTQETYRSPMTQENYRSPTTTQEAYRSAYDHHG